MTTHSGHGHGQGAEPPYEGVVLPANGEPWTIEQQRQAAAATPQPAQGQPWGQPWGPEAAPAPGADGDPSGTAGPPGALPPADGQAPYGLPGAPDAGHTPPPQAPPAPGYAPAPGYGPQDGGQPGGGSGAWSGQTQSFDGLDALRVPEGSEGPEYAVRPPGAADSEATQLIPPQDPGTPAYGTGGGAANGWPQPGVPGTGGDGLPAPYIPGGPSYGIPDGPQASDAGGHGDHAEATQLLPSMGADGQPGGTGGYGYPGPHGQDTHGTYGGHGTHGGPVPDPAAYGAQAPGGNPDSVSTQLIPPVAAPDPNAAAAPLRSPLPPEAGTGDRAASGAGPGPGTDPGHPPAAAPRQAPAPDTYGIHPGPPEERKPLAEFDSLFRSDPAPGAPAAGGTGGTGATRNMPRVGHGTPPPGGPGGPNGPGGHGAYGGQPPQGRAARRSAGRERDRGPLSPPVLIGVAVVAVIGLTAGAVMSMGGDGDSDSSSDATPTAPGADGGDKSVAPADPAEKQAKALDKLLESSNNSRTSVINAVANIKSCKKLPEAAADLRAAAKQRNGLVTSLGELETGELPDSEALNTALTRAWKASAEADSAYAAWAGQVAGKKGCPKGKARSTDKHAAGNRASGEATTAKKEAAGLWNPTAAKYGLSAREITQL
ncbi:hypothetical protein [Streptomyces sp. Z26]|uniref:hypothetical protein n=1 Tax=Streptomyces sp. Z26 TaxID=2500177 RepID=UPI001F0C9F67|nr:hypothetical protein [Streptomyces sp. Z26]